MRYALIQATHPGAWAGSTHVERAAWAVDDAAYAVELADRGVAVFAMALADPDTATTVRVEAGQAVVVDGPSATPDHLEAILVIEVDDLDAALEVARRWPAARFGPLEVRPERAG